MFETARHDIHSEGFILTRHVRESGNRAYLEYWLLSDMGPLCVRTDFQKAVFFILSDEQDAAVTFLERKRIKYDCAPLSLKTFQHKVVSALYFQNTHQCYQARVLLTENGISCFESDIRIDDRFLMERYIYGSMRCHGINKYPTRKYPVLDSARCAPSTYVPTFKALSLDIECSENGELFSIGLASENYKCVLMIGEKPSAADVNAPNWIIWVRDEQALLFKLIERVSEFDPDVIIGWNIINFDFLVLSKRAKVNGVALNLGRDRSEIHLREGRGDSNQIFITIAGRVVIDGIDGLKSASYHFDDFSLDFVARTLLNKGKKTENVENRLAEIEHDFKFNKLKLAAYNLQDCELVLEIFAKTNLLQFLCLRSQLTGLELNRMGGSVAAFINVYLPKVHRAGYVAPNRPEGGGLASPGGYVMDSKPGLYQHVLVLDFKSLYPSIIRTFKIDPVGLVEGLNAPESAIPGFKGACFSREKHFLPDIIEQLWQARDDAKAMGDAARSQAVKILMNSFYGVLGSGGCPFYDTRLASSITMRGQEIMQMTATWIAEQGYEVIYGDTDSTFVWLNGDYDFEQAEKTGLALQDSINKKWQQELKQRYDLECALDIEFETYFSQFLMPTIRGSHLGSKKRYAGIKRTAQREELIFKGLETVRSDWTDLAKEFQSELYMKVFRGEAVEQYIQDIISDIHRGSFDRKLVYKKRLRRKLSDYVKTAPPHVKAARQADTINEQQGRDLRYQNKGWIAYVITLDGPQATENQHSKLDYDHYVEKQIRPVAEAILPFIGLSFERISAPQLGLFEPQ